MKQVKRFFSAFLVIFLICSGSASAQFLNVPEVIQEQSQWCWAAVSKCVLDYYGHYDEQCEIAEYTRTTATWHDFGPVNCCEDPNQGCNYWNYNWGNSGSIAHILNHFSGIQTNNMTTVLSIGQIEHELINGRPFIFRWGWTGGGGHFLVGHGLSGNAMHYMDPWYSMGYMIADYNWVLSSGTHSWTHTQTMGLPFTIQATANPNGHIFPEGDFGVTFGGRQSFILIPDAFFSLDVLAIDGIPVDLQTDPNWNADASTYTFTNISQNHTIEAWFENDETSISETKTINTRVFPNPATNYVYIESGNQNIMISNIMLYDIKGNKIMVNTQSRPNQNIQSIELNDLDSGIYILKIFYNEDEIDIHRIIKTP